MENTLKLNFLTFPQATASELEIWNSDTFPNGDWHFDRCDFDGLDKVITRLRSRACCEFTVVRVSEYGFVIRETSDTLPFQVSDSETFPKRKDAGTRGPLPKWTEEQERYGLAVYILTRSVIGIGKVFRVTREQVSNVYGREYVTTFQVSK
jgi:hypothetical protein